MHATKETIDHKSTTQTAHTSHLHQRDIRIYVSTDHYQAGHACPVVVSQSLICTAATGLSCTVGRIAAGDRIQRYHLCLLAYGHGCNQNARV